MKEKDVVIAAMEFAREKLLRGEALNDSEFNNHLVRSGLIPTDGRQSSFVSALFNQIVSYQDPTFSLDVKFMGLDAYLGLLDYEELQLARQDSARAREEARLAIQAAEEATKLTRKSLWWTRVSVIIATIVGLIQIIVTFVRP